MAVPSTITDLDTVAANNWPQDSDLTGPTVASTPRAHAAIIKKQFVKGTDIAVAASGVLTVPSEGAYFVLTGTGFDITGLTDAYNGRIVTLELPAGLTLINSASLILKGYDRTTFVGDTIRLVNKSAGVWKELEYGFALGRPSFRAYRNGSQAGVAADTHTKVLYNAESYDSHNMINIANGTATAPTDGRYNITAQVRNSAVGNSSLGAFIYKNGVSISASIDSGSSDVTTSRVTDSLVLAAGDTIEVYIFIYGAAGAVYGFPTHTYFHMSLED